MVHLKLSKEELRLLIEATDLLNDELKKSNSPTPTAVQVRRDARELLSKLHEARRSAST